MKFEKRILRCNYFGRLVGESLSLYMHIEHHQEYVVVVFSSNFLLFQSIFSSLSGEGGLDLFMKCEIKSMGRGKTMVEFFSAAMELRVCK